MVQGPKKLDRGRASVYPGKLGLVPMVHGQSWGCEACTLVLEPGFVVTVVDSITGEPFSGDDIIVVAVDGAYADTAERADAARGTFSGGSPRHLSRGGDGSRLQELGPGRRQGACGGWLQR